MERNFTNENLENFLKQSADGLRMLPSDKVWKGISKHFNQRRRRFGMLLGISLLISTGTGYYFINNNASGSNAQPSANNKNAEHNIPATAGSKTETGTTLPGQSTSSAINSHSFDKGSVMISSGKPGIVRKISTAPSFLSSEKNELMAFGTFADGVSTDQDPDALTQNDFAGTIVDDTYPLAENTSLPVGEKKNTNAVDPLSIESVMNSFVPRQKKKVALQVYFTPNISYRKLSENKAYIETVSPSNIPFSQQSLYDINSFVTHKPDFGFEVGLAAKYPVSKNVKLRAGVQFNVNRYDIKVFNSSTQLATIRLNNRNGIDSVNRPTNYSNTNGYKSNWLENYYFQVSAPIGVEFKVSGDDKVQFGVASTVQPTYVLGDRAYLISTDYKNYAEVPWLIRKWNVNTSLETFVSYSTGKLQWQVGPQVRYQLLSSFVKKYPVKENLFDFGLRVGVSLNQ